MGGGNASDITYGDGTVENALNSMPEIQIGSYTFSSGYIPADGYADIDISFSKPFSSTPRVFLTYQAGTYTEYGSTSLMVPSRSASGFTLRLINNSTRENLIPVIAWMAIVV